MRQPVLAVPILLSFVALQVTVADDDTANGLRTYGPPKKLCVLQDEEINESSGLAVSRRRENLFWTHNDSGDRARIFAFDRHGHDWGVYQVPGAKATDWEDMASFEWQGRPCLLLADVGDNPRRRPQITLYVVEEPGPNSAVADLLMTIPVKYENGSRDCESVAVDPASGKILLLAKELLFSTVYEFDLPDAAPRKPLTARQVARVAVPLPTAMDVSPDGLRAIMLTYAFAYQFMREKNESWQQALQREPRRIDMPQRRQGESICYGLDGWTLFLTSEKLPTPLWEVPVEPES